MTKIDCFIQRLASVEEGGRNIINPYLNPECQRNLANYLRHLSEAGVDVMLIGEAPGYRGCAITGVPFTDEVQLKSPDNYYALGTWARSVNMGNTAERTATMMWQKIREHHIIPLLWNAFPFHPHQDGNIRSNRAPTKEEVQEGLEYIKLLMRMFSIQIQQVYAIGKKAASGLEFIDSEHCIRHPSNDYNKQFPGQFDARLGKQRQ